MRLVNMQVCPISLLILQIPNDYWKGNCRRHNNRDKAIQWREIKSWLCTSLCVCVQICLLCRALVVLIGCVTLFWSILDRCKVIICLASFVLCYPSLRERRNGPLMRWGGSGLIQARMRVLKAPHINQPGQIDCATSVVATGQKDAPAVCSTTGVCPASTLG